MIIDDSTIIPEELEYEIYLQTTLQPVEEYVDYINRVIKNQLIDRFGFPDESPYSNFY